VPSNVICPETNSPFFSAKIRFAVATDDLPATGSISKAHKTAALLRLGKWREGILFAVVIIIWGLNYDFVAEGLTLSPPLWLGFFRVILGLAVAVPMLYLMKTRGPLTSKQKAIAFVLGIPGSGVFIGFWLLAQQRIPPGLASAFIYTYPLWGLVLSIPILGEHPKPLKFSAGFLAFLGVALISQVGFVNVSYSDLGAVAELIVGGFCFAFMNTCFKKLYRGDELVRANTWQLLGSTVTLGLWAALTTPTSGIEWGFGLLVVLLWLGVLGTSVAYIVFFTLMERYNASFLMAYLFMVVVVAQVGSYFIFGEKPDLIQGIGIISVIVAVYLVDRAG